MNKPTAAEHQRLGYLCELELQFQWEMPPVTSRDAGEGEYIGSGEGTAKGSRINGTVRWDLFEKREEALCRSHLIGVIETNDQARIPFDSRGFFIQPDETNPNKWSTSAAVYFHAADERYEWLNTRLSVWVGEFDMATFHHHYHVYVQMD